MGGKRPENPTYRRLMRNADNDFKKGRLERALSRRKEAQKMWSGDIISSLVNKVFYVRYADDILIGLIGPIRLAKKALEALKSHLEKLGLSTKDSKTRIVHRSKGVIFLGAKVSRFIRTSKKFVLKKNKAKTTTLKARVAPELGLGISLLYLLKKLEAKKVVKFNHKYGCYNATALRGLINKDHEEIIRHFNRLYAGIYNYYCFACNLSVLHKVAFLLRDSCALTLALKYKLGRKAPIYKKFHMDLATKVLKNGV